MSADIAGRIQNLTTEIGCIDGIEVGNPDMANATGGEVGGARATDTAGTDNQYGAGSNALLSLAAHLLKRKMSGIAAQHVDITRRL
jgi:hypothetical protein